VFKARVGDPVAIKKVDGLEFREGGEVLGTWEDEGGGRGRGRRRARRGRGDRGDKRREEGKEEKEGKEAGEEGGAHTSIRNFHAPGKHEVP
jgi:hypothetical protein